MKRETMEQQDDCLKNNTRNPSVMCRYQHDCKLEGAPQGKKSIGQQTERTTICIGVYLISEMCLTMDVERNVTAQQIANAIQSEADLGLSRLGTIANPAPTNNCNNANNPVNVNVNVNVSCNYNQPVFALWLCSSQLEIQLRPNHKPLELATKWPTLVDKYGSQCFRDTNDEEPMIYYKRNVFLTRREEEMIKEPKILELLFAEAKKNILQGRYPCESQARYASLGALQARIELGPYNSQSHTLAFFRKYRGRFLPHHYDTPSMLLGRLGLISGKGAPEARLLEQYKRIPSGAAHAAPGSSANPRKLVRKYLEFCWGLPCYGAAFFHGQIERPVRGLASWITNGDMDVLVGINNVGVFIVDDTQCNLMLGLRYSELNWEMAKPSDEGNPHCLPCLFLQFPVRENGVRVYKILQVFSRQAIMMDTLISGFAEESRQTDVTDDIANDNNRLQDNTILPNLASFTNKLSKFTLATFDDEGHCIGQMGSWSFQ